MKLTSSAEVAAFLFDTDNAFPAADSVQELTISDHNVLPAGAVLGVNVTQETTADHNGFVIQITGLLEKV